jgi:hypothetical protein
MQVTKPLDCGSIVITRTFAAARQKVFDALTKPDQVPRWFQPKQMALVIYEADLRTGGPFVTSSSGRAVARLSCAVSIEKWMRRTAGSTARHVIFHRFRCW